MRQRVRRIRSRHEPGFPPPAASRNTPFVLFGIEQPLPVRRAAPEAAEIPGGERHTIRAVRIYPPDSVGAPFAVNHPVQGNPPIVVARYRIADPGRRIAQNGDRVGAIGVLPDQTIAVRDQQLPIPCPREARQVFAGRDAGHGREGPGPARRHENDLGGSLILHGCQSAAIGRKR